MMEKRTNRVSEAQWDILLEFLEKNPNMVKARGYNNSTKGRQESGRQWQVIADVLNAEGLGAIKTPKDWSVYVSNYKSKLKKIVADINADAAATGGGPSQATRDLSDMDTRFLALLGPDFGQATPFVSVNQLPDVTQLQRSTFGVPPYLLPHAIEELPETLEQDEGSQDRSRSPVFPIPTSTANVTVKVEEVLGHVHIPDQEAAAGPRIPRQARGRRYRNKARRFLQQVELQRAAADAENSRALDLIGQNLGRLATAMEQYVAHIQRPP